MVIFWGAVVIYIDLSTLKSTVKQDQFFFFLFYFCICCVNVLPFIFRVSVLSLMTLLTVISKPSREFPCKMNHYGRLQASNVIWFLNTS